MRRRPTLNCASVFVLALALWGCSETSKPQPPDDGPPPGSYAGWIPASLGLANRYADLSIYTLNGTTAVSENGTFEVSFADPDALQPILAVLPDGTPILLTIARPSEGPIRLDATATARALLIGDPLFRDVPDSARDVVLQGMSETISAAASEISARLADASLSYLVDSTLPSMQRQLAIALRAKVSLSELLPAGGPKSFEEPWLASGEGGEKRPVIVNPQILHYAVELRGYYHRDPIQSFLIDRARLESVSQTGPPTRTRIDVPDGRYFMVMSSGGATAWEDENRPEFLAARENILEASLLYLRQSLWIEVSPQATDSLRSALSGLSGVVEVRDALAAGDGAGFAHAIGAMVIENPDLYIGRRDPSVPRILHRIASAYASATTGMAQGRYIDGLVASTTTTERFVTVHGRSIQTIDPPSMVRQPTNLVGVYGGEYVLLEWTDQATNEDGYIVERREDGFYEEIAGLTEGAIIYRDPFIEVGRIYTYRVTAYNQAAESEPSREAVVIVETRADTIPPKDVVDLAVESVTHDSIVLTWVAPGDDGGSGVAAEYDIRYSTTELTKVTWESATQVSNAPWPKPARLPERYRLSRLEPGVEYFIGLRARDEANNWSRISNVVHVHTSTDDPDNGWAEGFGPYPDGQGLNGDVAALVIYEGDLIAAGNFTYAGGVPANHIARWDGERWYALGQGTDGYVRCLAVYNGDLIAGGFFAYAGEARVNGVARWNGTSWAALGTGTDDHVRAAIEYNGDLFVGGNFSQVDGVAARSIARWDGRSWHPLGVGVDNQVFSFAIYQDKLVVGGDFGLAGDVPGTSEIATWDGESWGALGIGMDLDYVFAMTVYRGELIAGGQFIHAGEILADNLAHWDGTTWHAFGTGTDNWVRTLSVYRDELVVGGQFWEVDGVPSQYITRWDGSSWSPFGSGVNGVVRAFADYDGKLVVAGRFTLAGGKPSHGIAYWIE